MVEGQSCFNTRPVINPLPGQVSGVKNPVILLNGEGWKLKKGVDVNEIISGNYTEGWEEAAVPVQPALHQIKEKYAYSRNITIPDDWKEQRIFIRFDGANGLAGVYINGKLIKKHYGGFVSWDCEITGYVTAGQTCRLSVVMEDKAGEISIFNYGGLVRDVFMYTVPKVHLSRMHCDTVFDRSFTDASLTVHLAFAGSPDSVNLYLNAADGSCIQLGTVIPEQGKGADFSVWIKQPEKWDCEHPNLYTLTAELICKDRMTEAVVRKIGFRQIERRGKEVYVNGDRIKLHGVNRHDTYPLTDRVITHELAEQDVKLFKEANVNFIRTSHYPPRPDFLDFCDEYGIYVEDEASICFLGYACRQLQNDPEYKELFLQCFSEMVERDYSHPCILLWSLANECLWGNNFTQLIQYAHAIDKQRPTIFSFPAGQFEDDEQADVWSAHYVAFDTDFSSRQDAMGRTVCMPADVPVLHDESTHVPAMESQDLGREAGIRDFWGERLALFWKKIWNTDGALGAAIWAGIDNTKKLEDALTGPSWGIIDSWRRRKPEFWHVRKAYSPVILEEKVEECGGRVSVAITNRFLHSNLNEIRIDWKTEKEKGTMFGPYVQPFEEGILVFPIPFKKGVKLEITFKDKLGNLVDEAAFVIGGEDHSLPVMSGRCPEIQYEERYVRMLGKDYEISFSREDGMIHEGTWKGQVVVCGGPYLHLTGLPLGKWSLASMQVKEEAGYVHIILKGAYDRIQVRFDIRLDSEGLMKTEYEFVDMPYSSPRRVAQTGSICEQSGGYDEVGISYQVPKEAETFSWKRKGCWSVYPQWHIGRLEGSTSKHHEGGINKEAEVPDREWRFDEKDTPVYGINDICDRGTRDFASMKFHIYYASVGNEKGVFQIYSDGTDSVRIQTQIKEDNVISSRNMAICYTGNWVEADIHNRGLDGVEMVSKTAGDSCELTFLGTGIQWYSSQDSICGIANVYLDGILVKEKLDLGIPQGVKNPRQYEKYYSRCVYMAKGLERGKHTLRIEATGENAKDSFNCYVNIDHFVVLEEDLLGNSRLIINNEYNYTRLSWGIYEKEAVCADTGFKGSVCTRIGGNAV